MSALVATLRALIGVPPLGVNVIVSGGKPKLRPGLCGTVYPTSTYSRASLVLLAFTCLLGRLNASVAPPTVYVPVWLVPLLPSGKPTVCENVKWTLPVLRTSLCRCARASTLTLPAPGLPDSSDRVCLCPASLSTRSTDWAEFGTAITRYWSLSAFGSLRPAPPLIDTVALLLRSARTPPSPIAPPSRNAISAEPDGAL